jgi:hypothetical protein
MKEKRVFHFIAAGALAVFIMFGFSCSSFIAQKVTEPITYSEQITVPDVSRAELFDKAKNFFDEFFRGLGNSGVRSSDKDSGIINGKAVNDSITHVDQRMRYNSIFTVEVSDGSCKITFTEPTVQSIGYVSVQAKETAFQSYMVGYRSVPKIGGVMMPSNVPQTNEEIRAEWERKNVFSADNPGPETPAQYDYQANNFNQMWLSLTAEFKKAVTGN